MVQNSLVLRHQFSFPRVQEQANERMSAAERANEANSVEQANG